MISEKQIITKTKIANINGLNFFSTLNNILKVKGISISTKGHLELEDNKLYQKNGFQYLILNDINEFIILPNSKLDDLILNLKYEISKCCNENELINLIVNKM